MQKLISKRLLGLVLGAAFVLTAFFGVHLTMKDMNGQMQNCPLLGHMESVCTMNVTEHVNAWRQLLTANPQPNKLLLIIFAVASLLFGVFVFNFNFFLPTNSLQFVRNKSGPPAYASHFLIRAFSNGTARKRE